MAQTIRLLICDDHALVRRMLADWLVRTGGIEIVAEVESTDDAVAAASRHKPDIAILDIDMPGRQSFEAAETIRRISPQTRILFLSGHCSDHYIQQALRVGAAGYLLKGDTPKHIVEAIRNVARGSVSFSSEVLARLTPSKPGDPIKLERTTRIQSLSMRELEVLGYLARGMSKKAIANVIHVSTNTVGRHTTSLMSKLDIHDRVELALFAIREGIVVP